MWIFTAIREWAPVLAAGASACSAYFASRTASKSNAAAKDATHALAMAIRPRFEIYVPMGPDEKVILRNVSAFPTALDTHAEVSTVDGTHLKSYVLRRMAPTRPEVPGHPIELPSHPLIDLVMDQWQTFVFTIRFSDERDLQRWEQKLTVRRKRDMVAVNPDIQPGEVRPLPKKS